MSGDDPDKAKREKKMALLENQINILKNHFDSIQIFASNFNEDDEDNTSHFNTGYGNWFSRYGQVKEWVIKCEEEAKHEQRDNPDF